MQKYKYVENKIKLNFIVTSAKKWKEKRELLTSMLSYSWVDLVKTNALTNHNLLEKFEPKPYLSIILYD